MPLGDILVIKDYHKKAAQEIADMIMQNYKGEKISLALGAESGAGKSEIAHMVTQILFETKKIKTFQVHTDDFFLLPHKERNDLRKETKLGSIGPGEIDFDELNYVEKSFKNNKTILIPILEKITSSGYKLLCNLSDYQILLAEGLYAPAMNVDLKIFMDLTYHDTKGFRAERGKEVVDEYRLKVLEREHEEVSELRKNVDYIITKDFSLQKV
jgi:uridine kinase